MAQSSMGFDLISPTIPKQSSEMQQLAGKLITEFEYLFGLRGTWNSHWTEIAQRIYPMHAWLFQNFSQLSQQGDKRNFEVYDSTGILALNRFGAIMDSLLTPRNQIWHHIQPTDYRLQKDKACRDYFEQVNMILNRERYAPRTNFAAQNQMVYKSLGAYGTGALFIDDLMGVKGIRYKNIHLGELYLQENHQGFVDRVCRHFMLTARQAVGKWGAACPDIVSSRAVNYPESQFFFLHWVMPREDRDPFRKDFKGMPYASYYVSIEGSQVISEGGYKTFPYSVPRYEQAPNEAYGRSPAMDVLPAIKTLNEQKKTMLKQGHRVVDPVLLAHDDGIVDSFSLEPGAVNAGGVDASGRLLVHPLPTGNVQAGKELMEDERNLINDSFLVNLFQILTENPEMTATEVMERVREKGILLAPTVGRQQSEYLGPMLERELDILSRQGLLPPMPPLLKEAKGEYKIMYDSPISRTQRAEQASGAMRTAEMLQQAAQQTGNPSLNDYLDWDVIAPQVADINGTPATWIRDKAQIALIREQRARQQGLQSMIQAAPAMASMASNGINPMAPAAPAQAGGPGQGQPPPPSNQLAVQPANLGPQPTPPPQGAKLPR